LSSKHHASELGGLRNGLAIDPSFGVPISLPTSRNRDRGWATLRRDTHCARPYIAAMAIESELPNRLFMSVAAAEPNWEAVYAEQLPRVFNFFRYRLGSDVHAEDLTSRTFEKAWSARARYRRDLAGFSTWLISIARNVATDHLRAQRPHLPLEAAEDVAAKDTPHDEVSRDSDIARLGLLLQQLPQREQELVALKYGAEATNRAIAELTGLSESNVGTILHRVVQTLRRDW
jgi:RNA polymerase sigma-70 factor, ECF subfamily